jgi:DNA-binding Xre family transcriptional regulator
MVRGICILLGTYFVDNPLVILYTLWYKGGVAMPVSYAKLFDLMSQKGIKKVDLRKTYKINPKTVDSLVNNRSVTVDTIIQLCEILDCQPGDLMEYIPKEVQE